MGDEEKADDKLGWFEGIVQRAFPATKGSKFKKAWSDQELMCVAPHAALPPHPLAPVLPPPCTLPFQPPRVEHTPRTMCCGLSRRCVGRGVLRGAAGVVCGVAQRLACGDLTHLPAVPAAMSSPNSATHPTAQAWRSTTRS